MSELVGLGCLLVGLCFGTPHAGAEEILVSAAASLTDALQAVAKAYDVRSQTRILFNFGSSSELARQIAEGAPADIFFSADLQQMENLRKQGLIEAGSLKNILSNQLVIVALKGSRLAVRSASDLLSAKIKRIALAEPSSVPAGIYARKYLEAEGIWEKVKNKIIPAINVRAALASVESGNVDVAVVYRTDAAISQEAEIVYEIPKERAPKIVYPVALIKYSRAKQAARDFFGFLFTKAAKAVFQRYGFIVLP